MTKRRTLSSKAGIMFPVSRINRYTKKITHKQRISKVSSVYLASILEYLTAELLDLSGNAAQANKKSRITPRHLFLAIANDDELKQLLKGVIIAQGGVFPHLHSELLPKRKKPHSPQSQQIKNAPILFATPPRTKKQFLATAKITKNIRMLKWDHSNIRLKKAVDDKEKKLRPVSGITVLSEKSLFLGQKLTVIQGDILNVAADAIVHPTSAGFYMGGQVGQALEKAGGNELKQKIADLKTQHGPLSPAEAALTPAYNVASKYVIHCNGPSSRNVDAMNLLEKTIKNCLSLAESENFKSLAFPLIGSGKAGFPKQQVAQTVLKAIANYFMSVMTSSLVQIYFVLFDSDSVKVYSSELNKIGK